MLFIPDDGRRSLFSDAFDLRVTLGREAFQVASQLGFTLGDFGRVKPGVLNDKLIPETDKLMRRLGNQPVSDFNITDEEREMHDRVYRFLIARHARDWAFDYEQVIFVAGVFSSRPDKFDLYYRWLTNERYASSRVRFNTIADDVGADLLDDLCVDQRRALFDCALAGVEECFCVVLELG